MTDLVSASVQVAACNIIEPHQTLKLSVEDSEAFVNALLKSPIPNNALNAAALRYKQVIE